MWLGIPGCFPAGGDKSHRFPEYLRQPRQTTAFASSWFILPFELCILFGEAHQPSPSFSSRLGFKLVSWIWYLSSVEFAVLLTEVSSILIIYCNLQTFIRCDFANQGKRDIRRAGNPACCLSARNHSHFCRELIPGSGIIVEQGHPLRGESIRKVLVFPLRKGFDGGFLCHLCFKRNGHGPAAIVNTEAEPIIATGAIIGRIPMIDRIEVR